MELSHTPAATSALFDDPNLIASSGLVPMLRLEESVGLSALGSFLRTFTLGHVRQLDGVASRS